MRSRWRNQDDTGQDAEAVDLRSEPTLDLRDGGPGRPGPCPRCGTRGYLDQIRARAGIQTEHCPECACRWNRVLTDDGSGDVRIID